AYGVWSEGEKSSSEVRSIEKPSSRSEKRIVKRRMPPESAYRVVEERTLFSPERALPDLQEKEPKVEEIKDLRISGKKFFLYGVIIVDDYKAALITNPEAKHGKKKQKWVMVGDSVGAFRVAGIKKDRIILAQGAREHEILLYDMDKPKVGAPVRKNAKPTVVSTVPTKSAPPPKISKKKELPEGEYETISTPFGKIRRKVK
ncbi:MAG: hypothetical protein KAU60_06960, partial [Desulfobacterales bacterium]|nr:hypothetical protein [Desulfobacterales bacterium]